MLEFDLFQFLQPCRADVSVDGEDLSVVPVGLSSSPPSSTHVINDKSRDMSVHSPTLAQNAARYVPSLLYCGFKYYSGMQK